MVAPLRGLTAKLQRTCYTVYILSGTRSGLTRALGWHTHGHPRPRSAFCSVSRSTIAAISTAWGCSRGADPTPVGEYTSDVHFPSEVNSASDHQSGHSELCGTLSPRSWPTQPNPESHMRCTLPKRGHVGTRTAVWDISVGGDSLIQVLADPTRVVECTSDVHSPN